MPDLLLRPPLSVASLDEAGQNDQEQDAMVWGSIALAALDDDDDFDVHNDDKDEKKDDDGADGGVVLTASSSDIGSVQSRAKDGHDSNASMDNGGGNAFGHLTDVEARELEFRQMREIQYLQQQCHEGGRLLAASREENTTLQHQIKESDEYATQAAEMVTVSRTRLAEAMEANETDRKSVV